MSSVFERKFFEVKGIVFFERDAADVLALNRLVANEVLEGRGVDGLAVMILALRQSLFASLKELSWFKNPIKKIKTYLCRRYISRTSADQIAFLYDRLTEIEDSKKKVAGSL